MRKAGLHGIYNVDTTLLEELVVTTVQRWGNSLAVRIPKAFADQARLGEDSDVEISIEGDKIILAPPRSEWKLHDLVAKISKSNIHTESSWGDRQGGESW